MIEEATERLMVKAPPERCYQVATDFETYEQWSEHVRKVEVAERDEAGRPSRVRFWVEAMGRTTQFTLAYDHSLAPAKLSWHLADGDIEGRLDGEYSFVPVDDQTELTFHLAVELRVPMPGFVKRRAESQILQVALQEVKARAES